MIKVGIASLGTVGRAIALGISEQLPEYTIGAVAARRPERARAFLEASGLDASVVDAGDVAAKSDVVVECAPSAIYRSILEPALQQGKSVITLSVGALLDNWDLVETAAANKASIQVPSGALLGLDAVQGTAMGTIKSVHMVTRKPAAGIKDAPFVAGGEIDVESVSEAKCLFRGNMREAIKGFPANINVGVALSLAGIGPDLTTIEIWVDPSVERNTHSIEVISDSARLSFGIENVPSENAATGRLTALSVLALLKKQVSPLRIGT